ncbi:MAG: hypothetical protein ACE5JZ_08865 [Kiloniellales bacterium]
MTRDPGSADAHDLPPWIWLILPFALALGVVAARLVTPDIYLYESWVESERGVIENGTAVALFPAIVLGLRALRYRALLPSGWLTVWLVGLVAAAVLFAGEEISWGQQWLGWATPDFVLALNEQGEFNLHNVGKQLTSRTPKSIAGLIVALGGVGFPLWQRWRGAYFTRPTDWRTWVAPTRVVVPAAALAVGLSVIDRLAVWFDLRGLAPLDVDFGELHELCIALFLTFYVASIWQRLAARAAA